MEIVPSTLLALAAVIAILSLGPRRGLWVFLCLAPLGAAAAFNLPAVGGATIGMKEVGVLALLICVGLRPGGPGQMMGTLRFGQPGFPLLLFMIYSALSAVFAPVFFEGTTNIFSLSRDAVTAGKIVMIPLQPTSGNITQLFSLSLGFVAYLCLAATFRTWPDTRAVVIALACTTVFHVLLGLADLATFATGTQAAMGWLRSANYSMLTEATMIGFKRVVGGFPEASVYGAFALALFAFWLQFWARAPFSRLTMPMVLISLLVLLRSTSSAAYVGMLGFLLIFSSMQIVGIARNTASRQTLMLTMSLLALLWLSTFGLILFYQLSEVFSTFLNTTIIDKMQTDSGVERSSWNTQAFRNFMDTWMIGAGLGSTRASNIIVAALSNVGVPGTLLYIWFLVSVLRAPSVQADALSRATIMGLKAALVATMLTDLLTGTTPNQGVFFFALAGLLVGLSRAAQIRAEDDIGRPVTAPRGRPQAARALTGAAVLGMALTATAPQARAEAMAAPVFSAASNFGQGLDGGYVIAAWRLGLRNLRDEVHWHSTEAADGSYTYEGWTKTFPRHLARAGITMSLIINHPHPDYDGGNSPVSAGAVAAFARFSAYTVQRFPAITAVEVGNEMNSADFAWGPGWTDGNLTERAVSYTALLAETSRQVRQAMPGARVLGGAAMAVPLAWIKALADEGAARYMDALVLHPYTTPPEHLRRQFAAVRGFEGFARMPVEVTEFGTGDAAAAPGFLLRAYCQMALSNVTQAVWYPLTARGDGMIPLLDEAGGATDTGAVARFILAELSGTDVTDISPDPFTYGCDFGGRYLVIWGAPRAVSGLAPDIRVLSVSGADLPAGGHRLSYDQPLVLTAARPLSFGQDVRLAPQTVIADSFDQFGSEGPLSWFVKKDATLYPMQTMPGQERNGVPWTPYLGSQIDGRIIVSETQAVPVTGATIVLRYTAAKPGAVSLVLKAKPSDQSNDGIRLTATAQGRAVDLQPAGPSGLYQAGPLNLKQGDTVEIGLDAGADDQDDLTQLRLTLYSATGQPG